MKLQLGHLDLPTLVMLSTWLIAAVPYITTFFTRSHLPRWANELIAMFVSTVAGIIAWLIAGGTFGSVHDIPSLFAAVGLIFGGAKVFYKKLAETSPLMFKAPKPEPDKSGGYARPELSLGTLMEAATPFQTTTLPLHLHITSSFDQSQLGHAAPIIVPEVLETPKPDVAIEPLTPAQIPVAQAIPSPSLTAAENASSEQHTGIDTNQGTEGD